MNGARASTTQVTTTRHRLTGWFADRSLAAKKVVAVAAMALAAIVITVLLLGRIAELRDHRATMNARSVDSLQHVAELRRGIADMLQGLRHQTSADPTARQSGRDAVVAADARLDTALDGYRRTAAASPARQQHLTEVVQAVDAYRALRDSVFTGAPLTGGHPSPPDARSVRQFLHAETAMNDALTRMQRTEQAETQALIADASRTDSRLRTQILLVLVIGMLIAGGLVYLTTRLQKRQITSVSRALDALAHNDLAVAADVNGRDEFGRVAAEVNDARDVLRITSRRDPVRLVSARVPRRRRR